MLKGGTQGPYFFSEAHMLLSFNVQWPNLAQ